MEAIDSSSTFTASVVDRSGAVNCRKLVNAAGNQMMLSMAPWADGTAEET